MVAKEYSGKELMAVVCARELRDGETAFVGVGVPMMAGLVATKTHAKNATILYEAGGIGGKSRRLAFTISDNPCTDNALCSTEMWRVFGDTQCGFIDVGIVGGAQVDRFGNLNTTVITKGGEMSYEHPAVRLPGSGGGNDIGSSCRSTLIVMAMTRDKFVNQVDFITTPGYLTGPGAREAAGLRWGGPKAVITDKCLMRFDPDTKEMYVEALYPGISVEDVKACAQWDLKISENVSVVDPPSQEQIDIMRGMDPAGIILGKKSIDKEESFEEWAAKMQSAYEACSLD